MRILTLLVLIVLIAGGLWYANKEGWFEKAEEQVDTFGAHYAKGVKAYQEMRYDDAIQSFKTALSKTDEAGDRPMCLRKLGDCYREKEMYAEAMEIYQELIDKYPKHKIAADTRNKMEEIRSLYQ